ncbi:MAG: hypothetical protein D6704_12865 [Nitrospirae bacterium]|nr:MAG: hypothetical protein D6704_12865 [Nitrospirota bacterium]
MMMAMRGIGTDGGFGQKGMVCASMDMPWQAMSMIGFRVDVDQRESHHPQSDPYAKNELRHAVLAKSFLRILAHPFFTAFGQKKTIVGAFFPLLGSTVLLSSFPRFRCEDHSVSLKGTQGGERRS